MHNVRTISYLQTLIIITTVMSVFGLALVATTPKVAAQTNEEMELIILNLKVQILVLLERIATMNGDTVLTDDPSASTELIEIGSRVTSTEALKVRSEANTFSEILRTVVPRTAGTIISGPRSYDGYTWWRVRYDDGLTGWSAADWLEVSGTTAPVLTFNEITSSENPLVSGLAFHVTTVGFFVTNAAGTKVYTSEAIPSQKTVVGLKKLLPILLTDNIL